MKALSKFARQPAAAPLIADDVLEFHAGRIALLLSECGGTTATINGLTKLAKLDFFVRYPDFFSAVAKKAPQRVGDNPVETAMVRHHYGPWDKRYYHVLAYLESRSLISVKKSGKSYKISLTKTGKTAANSLKQSSAFGALVAQMRDVAETLGGKTGNELKNLIYTSFSEEVAKRPMGAIIGERE
jgi:hypothetical protein